MNTNNNPKPGLPPSPSARLRVPEQLTNRHTHLFRMGDAAMTWNERYPEEREQWKGLSHAFQEKIVEYCPAYAAERSDDWGIWCGSGKDGKYFRAIELCARCIYLLADNDPKVIARQKGVSVDDFIPLASLANPQDTLTDQDRERLQRAYTYRKMAAALTTKVRRAIAQRISE